MTTTTTMAFASATLARAVGLDEPADACAYQEQEGALCWAVAGGPACAAGGLAQKAVDAALDSFARDRRCLPVAAAAHLEAARKALAVELGGPPPELAVLVSAGGRAAWATSGAARVFTVQQGAVPRAASAKTGPPAASARTLESGDAFLLATGVYGAVLDPTELEIELAKSSQPGEWLHRLEARVAPRSAEAVRPGYAAAAVMVASAEPQTASSAPHTARRPARSRGLLLGAALAVLIAVAVGAALVVHWRDPQAARRGVTFVSAEQTTNGMVYRPAANSLYPNLQQALAAARSGETLWIGPGVHQELPPVIDRQVRLLGAGAERTTLVARYQPLELRDPVIGIENLKLVAGPGVTSAIRLTGEFSGFIRMVFLEGNGRDLLSVTGRAHPTLENNTLRPIGKAQCFTSDSERWIRDALPAGNLCMPPYDPLSNAPPGR
jgi:hypothetical protein